MDQIREHITQVLDKQGVLSRLKAELRANVFLAINDQDIRQGGIGLGSKTDAAHRKQLSADSSGTLLLELVRELMQWCNLQFTQQVFEQELQLGPAAALDSLQQQLALPAVMEADEPLLLKLLKHHLDRSSCYSKSSTWQPAQPQADAAVHSSAAALPAGPRAAALSGTAGPSRHPGLSLPLQQLRAAAVDSDAPIAPETLRGPADEAVAAAAADLSADSEVAAVGAAGGSKLPNKSVPLLGEVSVAEDSGLIGTQMEEEEYATVLLPQHRHTSSDAGLDGEDDASSTSSTAYPVDTPRLTSRPVRAAAAPAAGQQAPLSALGLVSRPSSLPPLAAAPQPAGAPAAAAHQAVDWHGSDVEGMAAACELSESFGHDRSFGDSSLELQGLDSPTHPSAGQHTRQGPMDAEASYSSSKASSSRGGSSRAFSPQQESEEAVHAEQQQSSAVRAASTEAPSAHPPVRPPGKLAPLPPVAAFGVVASGADSSSSGAKRSSEGVRDELLRSGLLASTPPAAPTPPGELLPQAEPSTGSFSGSEGGMPASPAAALAAATAAAAAAGGAAGARTGASVVSSEELSSWRSKAASAVAAVLGAGSPEPSDSEGVPHTGTMSLEEAGGDRGVDGGDSDDFGAEGQQQLLQAARRRLSDRSNEAPAEPAQQQQQQDEQVQQQQQQRRLQQTSGRIHLELSGASLTLTCSDLDDDDDIPEDISLPLDDLAEDSEFSAVFEAPQQGQAAAAVGRAQAQAWSTSTQPAAATAAGSTGVGPLGGGRVSQGAQQALELTDSDDDGDDEPLAAGGGFVIDDDDF